MLGSDVRVGRIAGIPVHLNWTVLVLVWLLGSALINRIIPHAEPGLSPGFRLVLGLIGAAAFVGSILAHELGHAAVARHGGVKVERISLWLFGGMAQMSSEADRPPLALRIAAAGPAVSLALGGIGLGVAAALHAADTAPGAAAVASWLGTINLLLAAFNLLPGLPLDGGRILQAALWWRWGDRSRAVRVTSFTGRLLGAAAIALGFYQLAGGNTFGGVWTAVIGWFLVSSARAEGESHAARAALTGVRVHQVMSTPPPSAPSYLTVEEFLRDRPAGWQGAAAWPLRNWGGELEGILPLERLRRIPAAQRAHIHLRQLALPLVPDADGHVAPVAHPDELVLDVLDRTGGHATVVLWGRELVGLLTTADVHRALSGAIRTAATPATPVGAGAQAGGPTT